MKTRSWPSVKGQKKPGSARLFRQMESRTRGAMVDRQFRRTLLLLVIGGSARGRFRDIDLLALATAFRAAAPVHVPDALGHSDHLDPGQARPSADPSGMTRL